MLKKTLSIGAIALSMFANAQLKTTWESQFDSNIQWQEVSSLGNYVIVSSNGLQSINPNSGEELWNAPQFANINQSSFTELGNSPFAKINTTNGISIVNLFNGNEVFNSQKQGFSEVTSEHILYLSNTIIITGKKEDGTKLTVSLNIDDSKILWSTEKDYGRIIKIVELSNSELLAVTLFTNVRINSVTGETIWSAENSEEAKQLNNMGAFGNMMKNVAENMTANVEIELDFSLHPNKKYFIIGSQQEEESTTSSSSTSKPIIRYTSVYNAYDVESGELLWKKPLEVKGKLGFIKWYGDNFLVLPDGGDRSKVNLFNITTCSGAWGKKGKGIAIKGGIVGFTETEEGLIVITNKNNNHFLNYLDTKNGLFTFDKTIKIKGYVGFTTLTDKGLLYATHSEMNIVNILTGETLWEKDIKTNFELITQNETDVFFVNTKESVIQQLNKSNATITMTGKTPFDFQEKEYPAKIELRNDGIFLSSNQNFAKYNFDGELVYNTYYASPREEGWKRALLIASSIYAGYHSAVSGVYAAGFAAASTEFEDNTVENELSTELSKGLADYSSEAGAVAKQTMKAANARFKATKEGHSFVMVMTKTDNGIELVKISKETGLPENSIFLGKEKKPNYTLDLIEGKVFLEQNGNEINCYDIN